MATTQVAKIEEGNVPVPQAGVEIAMSRAAQEVQSKLIIAKRFPRNVFDAQARIMEECKRPRLAELATYAYPRGGSKVEGPSIRLAEVLQRNWQNFEAGVIELERRLGESTAMAYAHDLENNVTETRQFAVKHWRDTKQGGYQLTDERDIEELILNKGARRKRACILALIPGDVVEDALDQCEKTLKGQSAEPLADRVKKMVEVFDGYQVKVSMLEARLGHKLEATSEAELVSLRKIYTSLKDGMSKREDWFALGPVKEAPKDLDAVTEKMKAGKAQKPEPSIDADDLPFDPKP